MTRQGRQDIIAIVCAFVGAGVLRRLVPPIDGLPVVAMSIAGAAVGLMLARAVFKVINDKHARDAENPAGTSKDKNDAEFAAPPHTSNPGDKP